MNDSRAPRITRDLDIKLFMINWWWHASSPEFHVASSGETAGAAVDGLLYCLFVNMDVLAWTLASYASPEWAVDRRTIMEDELRRLRELFGVVTSDEGEHAS